MKLVIGVLMSVALSATSTVEDVRMRADRGDAEACLSLATVAERQGNQALAARWLRKAADAGSSAADAELGQRFLQGRGVPRNYQLALRYMAKAGNSAATAAAKGEVAARQGDRAAAAAAFREAAASGRAAFQRKYGLALAAAGNAAEARTWLAKAAEADDGDACFELAERLAASPAAQERAQAAAAWQRAIDNSDGEAAWAPRAYLRLARFEAAGEALLREVRETLEPLERGGDVLEAASLAPAMAAVQAAALGGSGPACFALATLEAQRGRGTEGLTAARPWLQRGEAAHDLSCACQLAEIETQGLSQDKRAERFRQAFAGTDPARFPPAPFDPAVEALVTQLEEIQARYTISGFDWAGYDLGQVADVASAKAFWTRNKVSPATFAAGRAGLGERLAELPPTYFAHVSLGSLLYRKARYVEDPAQARDFLAQSAGEGNLLAQYALGREQVKAPATRVMGLAFLALSAAQGHRGAARALDREESGAGVDAVAKSQDAALSWWDGIYR